ncbi:I78 family peptidase inhibitor [Erythrobacter sp. R86502]|uniref:I78 family peptidase inhibitor n=1 Tax=Erythrobacter sp. R86502 TaxID=3093846 RepID=UPI0036D2A1C2
MFGAASLLAGCQSDGERVIARAQRLDTCGAKPIREFVWRIADQLTREAIEQRLANAQEIRWISPGDKIIANLSTGRINISVNENGKIQHIGCY